MSEQGPPLLQIKGLYKSFAQPVLENLNLEINKGEVHALLGSNGAGKSTLCNIIAGIHSPSSGELLFDGNQHAPKSLSDAEKSGIRMVMQELSVFDNLTVAENICFKHFPSRLGRIDHMQCESIAKGLLAKLGQTDIDVSQPLSALGVGQKQLVEIARVLDANAKLLILDEPTAALTDPEIASLFICLEELKAKGISIIYISHRMNEIKRIADRVSVLRDGQLISTVNAATANTDELINQMAGQDVKTQLEKQTTTITPYLKISNYSKSPWFNDISLIINKGEVLGIGGLMGAGRTEFLRCLYGADIADKGELLWLKSNTSQKPFTSPKQALANGVAMLVEDRKQQGLLLSQSIADNIGLSVIDRFSGVLGKFNRGAQTESAKNISKDLAIKCNSLDQSVGELSGGNQQKALIARVLMSDAKVLLFDEPSRGVDAKAKAAIQQLIREQAKVGKAVVVVSSETQELLNVSDRIVMMSNGQHAGEFEASTVSESELVAASFKYHSNAV